SPHLQCGPHKLRLSKSPAGRPANGPRRMPARHRGRHFHRRVEARPERGRAAEGELGKFLDLEPASRVACADPDRHASPDIDCFANRCWASQLWADTWLL